MKALYALLMLCLPFALWAEGEHLDEGEIFRYNESMKVNAIVHILNDIVTKELKTRHYEEEPEVRRYFTGDVDEDGETDVLLATGITAPNGNYWSVDFFLYLTSQPETPIIYNFGGKGRRSYRKILMGRGKIYVDAATYVYPDALCCPSGTEEIVLIPDGAGFKELSVPLDGSD